MFLLANNIRILFIIIITSSIIGCGYNQPSAVEALFPNPPDTTNRLEFANFIDNDKRELIIQETTTLINGEPRKKGNELIPQNGDDFREASLDKVNWSGVQVIDGDFRGVSFQSAECIGSNFSYSNFRLVDVQWSIFNYSFLAKCNFTQADMFHFYANDSHFTESDFRGANMFGMMAHRANMRNCDFSYGLMKDIEFPEADLTGSNALNVVLFRAVLSGSKIDSCDFSYSDFTGAWLDDVSFVNSRFINTNFSGAHLKNTNFTGANLDGCNFIGARFENTDFTGAINIPAKVKKLINNGLASGVAIKGGNNK